MPALVNRAWEGGIARHRQSEAETTSREVSGVEARIIVGWDRPTMAIMIDVDRQCVVRPAECREWREDAACRLTIPKCAN